MKAQGARGFIHNLRHIRLEAQYDRRMLASSASLRRGRVDDG
jgi:hypothetical protein